MDERKSESKIEMATVLPFYVQHVGRMNNGDYKIYRYNLYENILTPFLSSKKFYGNFPSEVYI